MNNRVVDVRRQGKALERESIPVPVLTMQGRFMRIFEALQKRADGETRIIVEVEYDQVLGHPARLVIDHRGLTDARSEQVIHHVACEP